MEYQVTILLCAVALAVAVVTVKGLVRDSDSARRFRFSRLPGRRRVVATVMNSAIPVDERCAPPEDCFAVSALRIVPLSRTAAQAFVRAWLDARAVAKLDLDAAVTACDRLLGEVMCTLGYPLGDLESFARELSQNHAAVMRHYAEAHGLALRHACGAASRDELVRAMDHFEELFEHLLLPSRSNLRTA